MAYTKANIEQVDDAAPGFGVESQEARFLSSEIDAERIGCGHYRVKPGQRIEFGHRHRSMEEGYLILAGSGTFRVDDDTFAVAAHDVVRVAPQSWRGWEAGEEGMEVFAFGEHVDGDDESELDFEWWPRG